ncbi:DUF4012 domain-containing protein, partial [Patescibacteria group bacterium]|nr:DUF4012 domain-containing protein [Patescibacteria group bacterium]
MTHTQNFLEQSEPEPVRENKDYKRFLKKMIAVLFIFLFSYFVISIVFLIQATANALDGADQVNQAKEGLYTLNFDQAGQKLNQAEEDFDLAASRLKIFSWIKIVPWFGDQLQATQTILQSGSSTAHALAELLEVAEQAVRLAVDTDQLLHSVSVAEQISWSELDPTIRKTIVQNFASAAPDLELAKVEIDLVLSDLQSLDQNALAWPLQNVLNPFEEQLTIIKNTLDALVPVAYLLPAVSGLDIEQSILVLLLNNAEIRPGGGFIGSYGILTFNDAQLTNLETHDVMNVDRPAESFHLTPAPEPLQKYIPISTWFFRDSNWSPDFSTSTVDGLNLFYLETATAPQSVAVTQPYLYFDAVIAITPDFVSDLLSVVGSITHDGQTFSAENILTTLEYAVEYGFVDDGTPFEQRKEIIGELATIVKDRLFDLPADQWAVVFAAVGQALENKHLVMYSLDQDIQQMLVNQNWAGQVSPGEIDTLMVVDANMSSLKTDPAVEHTIDYEIYRDLNGRLVGQVSITYDHQGQFDWKTSRYRTYTRIYVPLGSELISSSGSLLNDKIHNPDLTPGQVVQSEELGLTVFGAFISTEPGTTNVLSFEYYLPDSVDQAVNDGEYTLDLIKQIGTADHNLNLNFDFDKKVKAAYPGEESDQFGDDQYRLSTKLDQDR